MTQWVSPPHSELLNDEVHIWRAELDVPLRAQQLAPLLAPDETERARRFYFERDRISFTIARGVLRVLLGRYLGLPAGKVRFGYASHGKPYLLAGQSHDGLNFNVSHSHGLGLFAFTKGRELGVDLEQIRQETSDKEIAERFFSQREVTCLRSLPSDLQAQGFFNCWTRKEAYIKARGEGLSMPLDKFDVTLAPGEPAALLETRIAPGEVERWSFLDIFPGEGFAGAVAVEGNGWKLRCWRWED